VATIPAFAAHRLFIGQPKEFVRLLRGMAHATDIAKRDR
jgi:hypothetical protein